MSEKIKLTPVLLAQQGSELSRINSSYKSAFQEIDKIMNSVNENWSKNIANNFTNKIRESTKITNVLTDTIDKTVTVIHTVGNKFENLDRELAKIIQGEDTAGDSSSSQGYFASGYQDFQEAMDSFEAYMLENFTKEQRDKITAILNELIGKDRVDEAMNLINILRGSATGDTYLDALHGIATEIIGKNRITEIESIINIYMGIADWDTYKNLISAIAVDIFDSNPYTKAFTIILDLSDKYMKLNDEMNNAVMEAAANHDVEEILKQVGKGLVKNLGGGYVDVCCRLIDSTFHISKYVQIGKAITGVDVGQYFNAATATVNSFWDKVFR